MKARIYVEITRKKESLYHAMSEIIEWKLPLPIKGDQIHINFEDKFINMRYRSKEIKNHIGGNIFNYKNKVYEHDEDLNEFVMNLCFECKD